jgi:hypothetical protein
MIVLQFRVRRLEAFAAETAGPVREIKLVEKLPFS